MESESGVESGVVDILGDTVKFLIDCEADGEVVGNQVQPSIYMVPSVFRDLSPSSFTPRVVAIGPLHRHDEHLQVFESQKTTYLHNLLRHSLRHSGVGPEQTLRKCTEKVIRSIERIKVCYGGLTSYNDFEVAKIMVIDGCFIVEFLRTLKASYRRNQLITPSILFDLLLIENQIPFFVLEDIFECTLIEGGSSSLTLTMLLESAIKSFGIFNGNSEVPSVSNLDSTPDHILGFLQRYYHPAEPLMRSFTSDPKSHSAVELERAGMSFKPNEDGIGMKLELPRFSWLPWFWCKPTLRMPIMGIGDYTELILRNLIIYEQGSDVGTYVTAYIFAMDMLIDTPQDVALLVKSKVLTSLYGSNEEAADVINKVCKNVTMPQVFYVREWEEMDAYYNSYWPHTIAGLKRTYFSNPWSVIALIAAFVLFILTVVQTIFTIKSA